MPEIRTIELEISEEELPRLLEALRRAREPKLVARVNLAWRHVESLADARAFVGSLRDARFGPPWRRVRR